MKIEEGKFYRTRDGRKVGPYTMGSASDLMWVDGDHFSARFLDGRLHRDQGSPADLVAEWIESPVRTVTRKEIVPGIYGKLNITGTYQKSRVTLDWVTDDFHSAPPIVGLNADELRAAAATLTEIADALGEAS